MSDLPHAVADTGIDALPVPAAPLLSVASTDRDAAGRFVKGNTLAPCGGRKRRPDIYFCAEQWAEREGVDLRTAIGKVIGRMLQLAEAGDTQAAKLVLDRLCDSEGISVHFSAGGDLSDAERAHRLTAIISAARTREAPSLAD